MENTLNFINSKINGFKPETAIVLGSGLGAFCEGLEGISIPYNEIPNFKSSTVLGHKGELLFAKVSGKKCVIMQGRFHFYEGNSLEDCTFPIKIFKKLGVKDLILTNAAGSLKKEIAPGNIMLISDHINLMGTNPLIGQNDDTLGARFPDMSEVYSKKFRKTAIECAKELNINLFEGIYCALTGPSYETPAEVQALSYIGGSAAGMSTVPEAIVAKYCGMKVLALSLITNFAAGLTDNPPNHQEVLEIGKIAGEKLIKLIKAFLEKS